MTLLSHRWKRRLKWGELIVILALAMGILVLGVSYFLRSYYGLELKGYTPFDTQRGAKNP